MHPGAVPAAVVEGFEQVAPARCDAEDVAIDGIDLNFGVVVLRAHFEDAFVGSEVDAVDSGHVREIGMLELCHRG